MSGLHDAIRLHVALSAFAVSALYGAPLLSQQWVPGTCYGAATRGMLDQVRACWPVAQHARENPCAEAPERWRRFSRARRYDYVQSLSFVNQRCVWPPIYPPLPQNVVITGRTDVPLSPGSLVGLYECAPDSDCDGVTLVRIGEGSDGAYAIIVASYDGTGEGSGDSPSLHVGSVEAAVIEVDYSAWESLQTTERDSMFLMYGPDTATTESVDVLIGDLDGDGLDAVFLSEGASPTPELHPGHIDSRDGAEE